MQLHIIVLTNFIFVFFKIKIYMYILHSLHFHNIKSHTKVVYTHLCDTVSGIVINNNTIQINLFSLEVKTVNEVRETQRNGYMIYKILRNG